MILGLKELQVIGKVLDEHVLELDCHGRPTMHLQPKDHPIPADAHGVRPPGRLPKDWKATIYGER